MTIPYPASSGFYPASTGVYPNANPDKLSVVIWAPETVGNGRLLAVCNVAPDSTIINDVQWRIGNYEWVTVAENVAVPSNFSFWVYGDDPLPGTDVVPQWEFDGSVWVAEVDREVIFVNHDGQRVEKASSFLEVQNISNRWYWEDGVVYYYPISGNPSDSDSVVTTPAFAEGKTYRLQVRVNGVIKVDEEFVWHWPVRDTVGHMVDISAPSFLSEVQTARDIYFAQGRSIGDLYSTFDDYLFQCYPKTATWSIPIWESLLGLPSIVSLSLPERRSLVEETVRGNGGMRTEFMQAVSRQVGSTPTVTDNYANYSSLIRIPLSGTDPESQKYRAAAESVINRIKPSGISVSVSYATFVAGVSKAGDAL